VRREPSPPAAEGPSTEGITVRRNNLVSGDVSRDMENIINVNDQATFQREVLDSKVPVLVDFWASWCGPCKAVAPELQILADAYGEDLRVVKVDVDANSDIAATYGVQSIPTIALFKSGEWVKATVGAKRARVIEGDLGLPGVA